MIPGPERSSGCTKFDVRNLQALVIVAAFSAACSGPGMTGTEGGRTLSVALGQRFEVAVGQTARIEGTDLVVRFARVVEDSRCPIDIECVWAGDGAVLVEIDAGAETAEYVVHTTLEPRILEIDGFRIRLDGLAPEPRSDAQIPAGAYVAAFEVTIGTDESGV